MCPAFSLRFGKGGTDMFAPSDYVTFAWFGFACAIIVAKWAAELGFSQTSQMLWAALGFFFPPLALLALYVRHLQHRKTLGLPGANWA
jgi:hypothetical protein